MSRLSKGIANWVVRNANLDLKSTQGWLELLSGGATNSGATVTQETSLKFSAVNLAARIKSETRASLPLMIYKNTDNGRKEQPNHPLYRMLAFQPNPWINYYDFWHLNNIWLELWGNAYHLIFRSGQSKTASFLVPIHPAYCTPKVTDGEVVYQVRGAKHHDGIYAAKDVIHFKGISTDGIIGKSPITLAAESIGLAMGAETFGAKYFKKDGVLRAIIQSPSVINDEPYQTLKKRWNENTDHSTPILDRGMTYNSIDIPSDAAQFLSTRNFQVSEIARFMNVPLPLLQDHTKSTMNNIQVLDLQFGKYTIRPILKRDETELENKLLGNDWPKYNIKWNLDAILRADIKSRGEFFAKMIQHRIMNPNEARAQLDMNPYPGGEKYENPNTSTEKIGSNGQDN